jgi:hypothetical protein
VTPQERAQRARIAALTRWSREDAREGTGPARRGFRARFERQVDPEGKLPPQERSRRAEAAMRAHMARMALRSAQARRKAAS